MGWLAYVVAITAPHSVRASAPPIIRLMPMITVSIEPEVVISSGHRYWFQP